MALALFSNKRGGTSLTRALQATAELGLAQGAVDIPRSAPEPQQPQQPLQPLPPQTMAAALPPQHLVPSSAPHATSPPMLGLSSGQLNAPVVQSQAIPPAYPAQMMPLYTPSPRSRAASLTVETPTMTADLGRSQPNVLTSPQTTRTSLSQVSQNLATARHINMSSLDQLVKIQLDAEVRTAAPRQAVERNRADSRSSMTLDGMRQQQQLAQNLYQQPGLPPRANAGNQPGTSLAGPNQVEAASFGLPAGTCSVPKISCTKIAIVTVGAGRDRKLSLPLGGRSSPLDVFDAPQPQNLYLQQPNVLSCPRADLD